MMQPWEIDQERWQEERRRVIERLESLADHGRVLPLGVVAHLLPINPEWDRYMLRRRGRPRNS